MNAYAVSALALVLTSSGDFRPVALGAIEITVPKSWRMSRQNTTTHFSVPKGEAYLEVDVGKVQAGPVLSPPACLDKIMGGIGGKDWRRRTLANAPAALKVDVDTDARGKQFISYTYVGCDGRTTWALSFHWIGEEDQQFAPLADAIAASLKYRSSRTP